MIRTGYSVEEGEKKISLPLRILQQPQTGHAESSGEVTALVITKLVNSPLSQLQHRQIIHCAGVCPDIGR
jgi:hypothetical protein